MKALDDLQKGIIQVDHRQRYYGEFTVVTETERIPCASFFFYVTGDNDYTRELNSSLRVTGEFMGERRIPLDKLVRIEVRELSRRPK